MMRSLSVTFLDLENNQKEKFDFYTFKQLYKAVRRLKIKNLEVRGAPIAKLNAKQRQALLNALVNNFHLQSVASIEKYFPKEQRKEIEAANVRNRLISEEKIYQDNIIVWLQNHPLANDTDCVETVIAMIEAYKNQFQVAREAMITHASEARMAGLARRMDVLMTHVAGWMKGNNQFESAVKYYLEISMHSDKYLAAHFAAFQLSYSLHHNETNVEPALTAFINAAPCCLDDHGRLIKFVDNDRTVFNSFLYAAAGMTKRSDAMKDMSDEQQHILFKYVLMRSVCLFLPSASANLATLFQERESRLKRLFSVLPKMAFISDVEKLMSAEKPSFDDVWEKTTAVVPSLRDTNQTLLFKAMAMSEEVKSMKRYSAA